MQPVDPSLQASAHPLLQWLFLGALALYAVGFVIALGRPALARWPVLLGAALHLAMTVGRGIAVGYFPLNTKMESFSGAALALAFVAVATWRPVRAYVVTMLILVLATMWAARSFPMDLRYPVPVLITVWYALHVPLSFTAYALWGAAAAAGLTWFTGRDPAMLARVDRFALLGMGLWSLSMVFGGIWGVLAWGAYFLWDPKIVWSVILWFHYATFVHLRLTPSLQRRPFVRPALALVGLVFVFVAYVGTSFFFGDSSHAFE